MERVGTTDSEAFAWLKVPRITFHSVTQETWKLINGPRDQWGAVRMDDYYASYRLVTVFLAYLDWKLGTEPAEPQK